jgi:hypothetical protein
VLPQAGGRLRLRDPKRRQEPEQETSGDRQHEHKPEDAAIHHAWKGDRVGDELQQALTQDERRHETGDAAERRQAQAFGEQLAHQASAAGAEGEPYGHLAVARGSARQQQVAKIGAGDQEHEGSGAKQHEQRLRE